MPVSSADIKVHNIHKSVLVIYKALQSFGAEIIAIIQLYKFSGHHSKNNVPQRSVCLFGRCK